MTRPKTYLENEAEAKCGDGQLPNPEEVISICQTPPPTGEDAKEPTLVEESHLLTSSDGVQKGKCEVERVTEDDVTIEKAVIIENTEEGDRGKFVNIFKSVCFDKTVVLSKKWKRGKWKKLPLLH